jgi:hypothetical protein
METTTRTKEEFQTVAKTILEQLGGNQFVAMTGAKNLFFLKEKAGGLQFNISSRNASNAGLVRIILEWNDTYTMQFIKVNSRTCIQTIKTEFAGAYCSDLCQLFTSATGLYTSLVAFG